MTGNATDQVSDSFDTQKLVPPLLIALVFGLALMLHGFLDATSSDPAADELVAVASPEPDRAAVTLATADLPVDGEALLEQTEMTAADAKSKIRNKIALPDIWSSIGDGAKGLSLDLSGVTELLDGTTIDSAAGETLMGTAYLGPYPFEALEADFAYKRFRTTASIRGGKASLPVGYFLGVKHNSEDWTDRGTVVLRLELNAAKPGPDLPVGIYDTFVSFRKVSAGYEKLPSIVEGPLVNLITSGEPGRVLVSFVTDEPAEATILLDDGRQFRSRRSNRHAVALTGLQPGETHSYQVRVGEMMTRPYHFQTAPEKGGGPVRFAYCGDSREGVGGGMHNYMGVNHEILHRHAGQAYARGADFFVFGGDLINGYTLSKPDFEAQLFAWKQAMSGFWSERAVFPAMGNHEALLRSFKIDGGGRVTVDRWPYDTDSAEAVFADAFHNPVNGPAVSDPRRPPYAESVFALQYGMVKVIAFNNNYWYSDNSRRFGGCPEGYIMEDQLSWIEKQLVEAETDETVTYVFLYAQEPVFPCGGHIADAMWYHGNNHIRAYSYRDGKVQPEGEGLIDVRNRFARAVGASSKVAAVLGSDEHSFYRVLIDATVPVGDPDKDDKNADNYISWKNGETASPLADLKHGVWYITCGGGGAPYYSEERTPWTVYWQGQDDPAAGFRYSSQENLLLFSATDQGVSLTALNPYGETIDQIDNLMDVK